MQIFKHLNKRLNKGQNLIEFVFILPILILLTLAILEVALFWQDVNSIYNLNEEINANVALIPANGMVLGDTCAAATKGLQILDKRDAMISMTNNTYTKTTMDGNEPFALYKYTSSTMVNSIGKPQTTLWVDCRSPFENGITTQIEFFHKTLIMKASIPRFASEKGDTSAIVIIPDNVFVASPKLNTLRHY